MNLICKLFGHNEFINQQFCTQTGALGPRTIRCRRCWQDLKDLPIPVEDY